MMGYDRIKENARQQAMNSLPFLGLLLLYIHIFFFFFNNASVRDCFSLVLIFPTSHMYTQVAGALDMLFILCFFPEKGHC